jgi:hypothetical protein
MEQTQCYETSAIKHHLHIHSPIKMEQTQCSETSAIKQHTPGNNPKDYTQNLEHGKSMKSGIFHYLILYSQYKLEPKYSTCSPPQQSTPPPLNVRHVLSTSTDISYNCQTSQLSAMEIFIYYLKTRGTNFYACKSGGHEKHAAAAWNAGNDLSTCLKTGKPTNRVPRLTFWTTLWKYTELQPASNQTSKFQIEGPQSYPARPSGMSSIKIKISDKYSSAPVSTSNIFQDLPRLRETADNTERYIRGVSKKFDECYQKTNKT